MYKKAAEIYHGVAGMILNWENIGPHIKKTGVILPVGSGVDAGGRVGQAPCQPNFDQKLNCRKSGLEDKQ